MAKKRNSTIESLQKNHSVHKPHYETKISQMRDRSPIARRRDRRRFEFNSNKRWPVWAPPSKLTDKRRLTSEEKEIFYFTGVNPREITETRYRHFTYVKRDKDDLPRLHSRVQLAYSDPSRVDVCKRRRIRRSFLFAMQKAGSGVRNSRARWTDDSFVRC